MTISCSAAPMKRRRRRQILPTSDRFIPSYTATYRANNAYMETTPVNGSPTTPISISPDKHKQRHNTANTIHNAHDTHIAQALGMDTTSRLLNFKKKTKTIEESGKRQHKRARRDFEVLCVMDAPGLIDDFYASPVSYNSDRTLAVGLFNMVYLWDREHKARCLSNSSTSDVYCLRWSHSNTILGVARTDGSLCFWEFNHDCYYDFSASSANFVQFVEQHGKACCLAWRPTSSTAGAPEEQLIVGTTKGEVCLFKLSTVDIMTTLTVCENIIAHTDQICGIAFRIDGGQFATGGNDNLVNVFDFVGSKIQKRFVFRHKAAVKALSYCTWQRSLLATGGGSNDRCLRIYDTSKGTLITCMDVGAQVTGVMWSLNRKEIYVTFGFTHNGVHTKSAFYAWPSLDCIASLSMFSEYRALFAAHCPTFDEIVICASDETVRIYSASSEETHASQKKSSTTHSLQYLEVSAVR